MKRLLIFLLLICAAPAWGAQWYLRSGQTTADSTGVDWTNAFNSSIKAESQMSEGDTLWVADGSYSYTNWNMSTRSGKVTYVIKATVAAHGTEDGWDNSYGDGQAIFTSTASVWWIDDSNYVFDGVSCTGDTTGYGFKLISTSTTSQYNTIQISGWSGTTGIDVVDSLTFKYIEAQGSGITNDYSTKLLYVEPAQDGGVSRDIKIQHCYFHDSFQNHLLFRRNREVLVEHCIFNRHSSGTNHGESINDLGSDSVTVRYNKFIDCGMGTGVIIPENNGDDSSDYWWIYGNLFYKSHGNPFNLSNPGNGIFATSDGNCLITYCYFFNNTIVNYTGGSGKVGFHAINDNGNNLFCYNNLWFNCQGATLERPTGSYGWSGYNMFVNCTNLSPSLLDTEVSQADTTGVFTDHLNYDFSLFQETAIICTTLSSPFNADPTGATRGVDGYWDAGYLEYNEDVSPPETTHTYYVQAGASGTGTYDDPFGTIAEAEAQADPNDRIVIDGTFREKLKAPNDSVTYRGWHNASPPRIGGRVAKTGFVTPASSTTDSAKIAANADDSMFQEAGSLGWSSNYSGNGGTLVWGEALSSKRTNVFLAFGGLTDLTSVTEAKLRVYSLYDVGETTYDIRGILSKNVVAPTDSNTFKALYDSLSTEKNTGVTSADGDTCWVEDITVTDAVNAVLGQSGYSSGRVGLMLLTDISGPQQYFRVESYENSGAHQATLYYTYGAAGTANPYVLIDEASRTFTRVWKSGVKLTQAATHAALEAGKFYRSAAGDSLFLVAADTTGIEIDGFDTVVDYNEKRGVTVRNIVVNGIGSTGAAITMDGVNGLLAHVFADSCSKAVYVNADSNRVLNNVISASDTAMIITPGKINIQHDYNGYTDKRPGDTTLPDKFIRPEPFDRVRRAA